MRLQFGDRRWLWVGVMVAVGCGTPVGMGVDAGGGTDAGPAQDAGAGVDAGNSGDGGADGGSTVDGGAMDAGSAVDAGNAADSGTQSDGGSVADAGPTCVVASCTGAIYECGDCLDDDGDGLTDAVDPSCTGACDNSEDRLSTDIPGHNNAPCRLDCFFDDDTGSGNDDCSWDSRCDPLETAPNYYPRGANCAYAPATTVGGRTCTAAAATQSPQCTSTVCGPVVPNGCDCFGCCVLPGAATPVYLGTGNAAGAGTCVLDAGNDPSRCSPCTQVPSCLNPCDACELCLGKTTLPTQCLDGGAAPQRCATNAAACGLPGQPLCPSGEYCVTGCCQTAL